MAAPLKRRGGRKQEAWLDEQAEAASRAPQQPPQVDLAAAMAVAQGSTLVTCCFQEDGPTAESASASKAYFLANSTFEYRLF